MTRRCSNPNCFVDDGESCAEGRPHYTECPSWANRAPEAAPTAQAPAPAAARVPWSGSTLGLADLANLAPRARSMLVGVIGAHDAGKTTLLLGTYLRLLAGAQLADARFAGSRTLGAWEALAAWTRFDDAARPPSFPPHTPRGTGRVPGMLHLALRGAGDELRDVLLTDAPGEWFTRWSVAVDSPDAEGARWVVKNADTFLVLADCERLCGPSRGETRSGVRLLLEQLANVHNRRPIVLVWAKADHLPGEGIRNGIRRTLQERFPQAVEVEASTERPESLSAALELAVRPAWYPRRALPIFEPILQQQPFAAYRGDHART